MFEKILWCPVDIPKFPILDFSPDTNKSWADWNFYKLTERTDSPYDITTFTETAKNQYPEVIKWLENFPYLNIRNVKFNIQKSFVTPHTDFDFPDKEPHVYKNNQDNEPCGYRILINGKRENSLFVMDGNKKIHTIMPTDTDVYVLGHTSTVHGVESEPGRQTMFLHFEIDKEKHLELLEKSYKKYKNYAIIKS